MIVAWVAYTISIGMLIVGIAIGYFLGVSNRNAKFIVETFSNLFPSLEKAMKEGKKDDEIE